MYAFLIVIHVIVCIILIAVVLLQAGRGGGMSDMGGGASTSNILGTQTSKFMTRLTEACAVIFVITSLSLAIMSAQRGKSLTEGRRIQVPTPMASAVATPTTAGTEVQPDNAATATEPVAQSAADAIPS